MWPPVTLLDATLPGIVANLALDEALLVEAEEGDGPAVLRFWEADAFAVILGASGRVGAEVRVDLCRADGVEIARRSSGGGTVVIGPGALNVTIVLPIAADPGFASVDVAQRMILGRVAASLRAAGPPVEVHGSGDLTLGLRKVSGSAQRRLRKMLMVHASILYAFPLEKIDRYLPMPSRRPSYRGDRPHADFVANIPLPRDRLVETIRAGWVASETHDPSGGMAIPSDRVERLIAEKFSDPRWIGRL